MSMLGVWELILFSIGLFLALYIVYVLGYAYGYRRELRRRARRAWRPSYRGDTHENRRQIEALMREFRELHSRSEED